MNEKRIWIAFLVMLQLGCCLSFGRYISSLGPLYRKIVPLANPAAALTSKPKRVTVLPIQETIDQGSGDFTRQLSAETPSVQTTFIAMTPAVDGNVTSEDLVSEYYRSLEFDSSGDNETGTLDSSTTVQREIGVSSLRIEEELTTQAFNETSTWNSRPMSTLYSTVQSSKDNKQIDSTSIFSKDNQTNFDTFASAAYTSPFASVLKDIPQEFATKPSNKVIAIKQNSSVKTLPEQNVPILQNKNASQAHTGYCKATAKLSYRLFKHYSVANTSVVEQRISIHFNLHKASNKYVFIDDYTSKTSDCYLSYRILQNSELELQSILGILRYGAPIRIKNHTVWIQLVADFGFGKKIKTSLLRTVYLDAVATNLRTDGITIQNFTIEAERKDISTLCMSTTCDVGTRCQVQESPNERWGECVSWCYDLTYCFNDGICQLNQNGKQICW